MPALQEKRALITGITGQDGSYLGRAPAREGLRSAWRHSPCIDVQHRPDRPSLFATRTSHLRSTCITATSVRAESFGRSSRSTSRTEIYNLGAQSHVRVSFDQPEYTADVVGLGTLRLLEAVREYSARSGNAGEGLSSGFFGDVWSRGPTSRRGNAFPSAQPICSEQSRRALVRAQLSRGVRNVCRQRHSVQPRIAATGRDVCHAQDHARNRTRIKKGLQQTLYLGNLEALPRLGLRRRLRRGDVADAPAGRTGRFRHRHRRVAFGPGVPRGRIRPRSARLANARRDRPALLPTERSGPPSRRRLQGAERSSDGPRRWRSPNSCR